MKLKKLEIILITSIVLFLATMAYAFLAYESITISDTPVGLTASVYQRATKAFVTCETAGIRWTIDLVSVPNSATQVGHILPATDGVCLTLESPDEIRNFRAVKATVTDAKLKVSYTAP